jgi:N6-L-threonylcarbamoyladenine synthase
VSHILAIESSCDDSGLAIFSPTEGIIYERTQSQLDLHRHYGGVVPGLAAREHLCHIPLLLKDLQEPYDLSKIDRLAVTSGPGLAGSLSMGIQAAQALAVALKKPLCGVHHLRGHLFSAWIPFFEKNPPTFPSRYVDFLPQLALLVSGGNTLLVKIDANFDIQILAATVDDAAGEALDKGAKLLGLPYPGGPEIEKKARNGNPNAYLFPKAFPQPEEKKFSFSGLKTSLRYLLEKIPEETFHVQISDLCASYQQTIIETLIHKTQQILHEKNFASLALSGGVAQNSLLRKEMQKLAQKFSIPLHLPHPRHSGDNATMIAFAAAIDPIHTSADAILNPSWKL